MKMVAHHQDTSTIIIHYYLHKNKRRRGPNKFLEKLRLLEKEGENECSDNEIPKFQNIRKKRTLIMDDLDDPESPPYQQVPKRKRDRPERTSTGAEIAREGKEMVNNKRIVQLKDHGNIYAGKDKHGVLFCTSIDDNKCTCGSTILCAHMLAARVLAGLDNFDQGFATHKVSIKSTYLHTAFTPIAPKSKRIQSSCQYLFVLLGSTGAKAACSTLMKLTAGINFINVLCTAFTLVDPVSTKIQLSH